MMKAVRSSFMQMLLFVRRDMMLFVSCFAPFLAGLCFKFAIPAIGKMTVGRADISAVLTPYYGLFDLFFSMLAPTMFCFAAAMVVLEEHDDHIEPYLFVTALGRKGYLISRIGIPGAIALIATLILLPIFKLTALSILKIGFLSITGAFQGVIIALLIVTLSTNKLEGMAVAKVSALTMLGALVPYFVPAPIQYVLSFLPSFWVGKAMMGSRPVYMLMALLSAFLWILLLIKKYTSSARPLPCRFFQSRR